MACPSVTTELINTIDYSRREIPYADQDIQRELPEVEGELRDTGGKALSVQPHHREPL